MTKRVWARYVRVSRVGGREGEGFVSPEIQRQGITALIKRSDGMAGPEFEDMDQSGGDFNREGIRAAIAWVMEDPARRGLATYDVSRWARTTSEGLAEVKRLRAAGAVYGSSLQQIDDTPEGNYMLTQWLALAELEAARTGRTWRTVHQSRADRGLPHGTPPLGYRLEDRRAVLDGAIAPAVVEVFERYARGETLKRVAARLSEIRGRHVATQNAKRVLRNRFYVGEIKYRGEWKPGAHEALVPAEVWARVELRLEAESGQASQRAEPRSWLLGLARCDGCGGGVQVVNRSRDGSGSLVCTSFRRRYPSERLCEGFGTPPIEQVEELVVVTLAEAGVVVLEQRGRGNPGQDRVRALEADLAALEAGRRRLTDALVRGSIEEDDFDLAMKQLRVDLADTAARLAEARRDLVVTSDGARLLDVLAALRPDVLSATETRAVLREVVVQLRIRRTSEPKPFRRWQGVVEPIWR